MADRDDGEQRPGLHFPAHMVPGGSIRLEEGAKWPGAGEGKKRTRNQARVAA